MPLDVTTFLITKDDYERVQESIEEYSSMTYEQFLTWNNTCIQELPATDRTWLQRLCKRIKEGSLRQMDLEGCVSFPSMNFYFDLKKRLCIVNEC